MFKEHDAVALRRVVAGVPLPAGSRGTVVVVHPVHPPAYLVEFNQADEDDGLHDIDETDLVAVATER
jgi:hypothetical protein